MMRQVKISATIGGNPLECCGGVNVKRDPRNQRRIVCASCGKFLAEQLPRGTFGGGVKHRKKK